MTSYYYFSNPDPKDDESYIPVSEDDVYHAIMAIAKKHGVKITDKMILEELRLVSKSTKAVKNRSRKINLYIDGTNLFAGQYDLFGPDQVISFRSLLTQIQKLFSIAKIYFYASYTPKEPKGRPEVFFQAEALFYHEVISTLNVVFYKGHRSHASGKEKGVDVHLAVDMVKDALRGKYAQAVLMTGDADLIYPLEIVKQLGYPVHTIFLPNRFSLELAYKANSATVLNYRRKFTPQRKLPDHLKIIQIKSPTCKQVG